MLDLLLPEKHCLPYLVTLAGFGCKGVGAFEVYGSPLLSHRFKMSEGSSTSDLGPAAQTLSSELCLPPSQSPLPLSSVIFSTTRHWGQEVYRQVFQVKYLSAFVNQMHPGRVFHG